MEDKGNSLYENYRNIGTYSHINWLNPPLRHPQPFIPIEKFMLSQANINFSHQNFYNLHQDQQLLVLSSHVFCPDRNHSHDSSIKVLSHSANVNELFQDHGAVTPTSYDWISTNKNFVNFNSQLISPSDPTKENVGASSSARIWVKGQWTLEEDRKLVDLVKKYGFRKWSMIATNMEGRIGKQCRERWQNHLRPDIKKDHWTEEEERLLIEAHERVGNKWAEIAKCITGRTENSIKNHWNATKRKQLSKRKIRRPDAPDGVKLSNLLEEYIKNKYFNKVSVSNNSNSNPSLSINVSPPNYKPLETNTYNNINEDDSISYLTFETYEEEMKFMMKLFSNNADSSSSIFKEEQVKSSSLVNAPENANFPSDYFSISTQMLDDQPHGENMESLESIYSNFSMNGDTARVALEMDLMGRFAA